MAVEIMFDKTSCFGAQVPGLLLRLLQFRFQILPDSPRDAFFKLLPAFSWRRSSSASFDATSFDQAIV